MRTVEIRNHDKSYFELFHEEKEKLEKNIKNSFPGLYEITHDKNESLNKKVVEELASTIAGNCYGFTPNERRFVYLFIKTSIEFFEETCPRYDFTFHNLHRLVDYVEVNEETSRCTFEYLLENTLERTSDKLSKSLIHDMCEILRKFNDKYISNKFKETMHLQIDDWKDRNLIVMLKDEDYVNSYFKLKFLNEEFEDESVGNKAKVYSHFKRVNRFELIKTIQFHKNPNYDYDELTGRTVAFCVNPLSCDSAYLKIYDESEDTWKDWYTTQIVERLFYEHKFLLRTLNTAYYFEIKN